MGVALGVGAIAGQVNIVSLANNTNLANATATAVPVSTETTVVSYSTTALKATWITQIFCSGQENSKWRFFEGGTAKIVQRIGAGQVNMCYDFVTPYKIPAGPVTIDVKVEHFVTGETPDFECSIIGYVET
jgi:hypothetical protein